MPTMKTRTKKGVQNGLKETQGIQQGGNLGLEKSPLGLTPENRSGRIKKLKVFSVCGHEGGGEDDIPK